MSFNLAADYAATDGTYSIQNISDNTNSGSIFNSSILSSSNSNLSADGTGTAQFIEDPCVYDKHLWLQTKFYLIAVCGSIVAAFGIFGNVTTAFILTSQRQMRTPNNFYLTALAIFDTILLLCGVLIYAVEYIQEYIDSLALYVAWTHYLPYIYSLSHVSQTGSVYTTVAVTIERFLAMVYPEKSRSLCTKLGALLTILGVVLFAVAFNLSKLWELRLQRQEQCQGFASIMIEEGPLLQNELYGMIHGLWLTQSIMVFLPFGALLVFNGIITYSLHRTRLKHKRKQSLNSVMSRDIRELKERTRDATIILVVIVVIFLICNFWGFVLTLLEYMIGKDELIGPDYLEFYTFSRESINFLAIVNSSINFVIYCIFGKDFRREVLKIYCCCSMRQFVVPAFGEDRFRQERYRIPEKQIRRFDNMRRTLKRIRVTDDDHSHQANGSAKRHSAIFVKQQLMKSVKRKYRRADPLLPELLSLNNGSTHNSPLNGLRAPPSARGSPRRLPLKCNSRNLPFLLSIDPLVVFDETEIELMTSSGAEGHQNPLSINSNSPAANSPRHNNYNNNTNGSLRSNCSRTSSEQENDLEVYKLFVDTVVSNNETWL